MATDQKKRAQNVTGVSNVTYDLTALFHNKLEGMAALQTYQTDADEAGDTEVAAVLQQLEQTARADVEKIRGLLARRLSSGG